MSYLSKDGRSVEQEAERHCQYSAHADKIEDLVMLGRGLRFVAYAIVALLLVTLLRYFAS